MKILLIGHGYVGSYLATALDVADIELTICSGSPLDEGRSSTNWIDQRYQNVSAEQLAGYDRILWFAGHSSVGAAVRDPEGAVRNNCFDLLDLARRKPADVPLIYASTASLYSVPRGGTRSAAPAARTEEEALISSLNAYDSSKAAFDSLVGPLARNTCGLRLGTVCGYSPRLRPELVFNSMNLSAIRDGRVKVANRDAWRSLLFLDDLRLVVESLLRSSAAPPRFINLASIDIELGDLAEQIASFHGADIEVMPDSETYSFRMDTALMQAVAGPSATTGIAERCKEFATAVFDAGVVRR